MTDEREREELARLHHLEEKAEREEEALHETLKEIREEIGELERHEHEHAREPFRIAVNNKPVEIVGHHHTGLEIKQAAKAAGLPVELDFVLSEELSHGRSRIIGDNQRIDVEAGACFEAIPNDDHS